MTRAESLITQISEKDNKYLDSIDAVLSDISDLLTLSDAISSRNVIQLLKKLDMDSGSKLTPQYQRSMQKLDGIIILLDTLLIDIGEAVAEVRNKG